MKIAILAPHRSDRPRFLAHLQYMLSQQTRQPDHILYVDYVPESNEKDITQRYKRGYEQLCGAGFDCILFCEVDDWYASNYIETMLASWVAAGQPQIFGPRYTEYYNIRIHEHFTMRHEQRTSAMATLIRPDLTFPWPPDNEPYTDVWLWERAGLKGELFTPEPHICLGIKHGDGMTGGNMHIDSLAHYQKHGQPDKDGTWLRKVVDSKSFEFYWNYFVKSE